jgi:hypothetical protein
MKSVINVLDLVRGRDCASPANLVAISDSDGGGGAASRGPRALGAKIIQKC